LSRQAGGDHPCPECGLGPNSGVEYVVEWEDPPTPEELREFRERREAGLPVDDLLAPRQSESEPPLPPCPRCGREREIVIDFWPDLGEPSSEPRSGSNTTPETEGRRA
jgi:predicted RNA-binding Zn-ribbon protein involved in translation (DUF1610 family)